MAVLEASLVMKAQQEEDRAPLLYALLLSVATLRRGDLVRYILELALGCCQAAVKSSDVLVDIDRYGLGRAP
jgi:hypothetical protein